MYQNIWPCFLFVAADRVGSIGNSKTNWNAQSKEYKIGIESDRVGREMKLKGK